MARQGFIHDKLDIKLLVLYLLDRVVSPIDFTTLTDLVMCDPGVDYFAYAEAMHELAGSGHLTQEDGKYSITEKGRRNSAHGESSLSLVIRKRCDQRLIPLNAELRRLQQVRAVVEEGENGAYLLRLSLDDDLGSLMDLTLTTASQAQCAQMARRFQAQPEAVYHALLNALLQTEDEGGTPPKKQAK